MTARKALAAQESIVRIARKRMKSTGRDERIDEKAKSSPMMAKRLPLAVENVGQRTDQDGIAADLHSTAVRIKVQMSHRLKWAQTTAQEWISIRMNHVHKLGVSRIQPHAYGVAFKQRTGRIQTGDSTDVAKLGARKAGNVCAQRKSNQMVVGRIESMLGVEHLDQTGQLLAHQLGVGRRLYVVGQGGTVFPIDYNHIHVVLVVVEKR